MTTVPIAVLAPIIIVELILLAVALIDCIRRETNGPKWLWIVLILLISVIGPVLYFVFGRKNR